MAHGLVDRAPILYNNIVVASLLFLWTCFPLCFALHVTARLGLGDLPHSDKYENDGEGLRPLKDAYAGNYADRHGDDGLDVVVNRDDGGT